MTLLPFALLLLAGYSCCMVRRDTRTPQQVDDDAIARWLDRIDIASPRACWQWPGAVGDGGYSHAVLMKRSRKPYRMFYEHFIGPVPEGMTLNHTCHDADPDCRGGSYCVHRLCVNPAHLESVSIGNNTKSAFATRAYCRAGRHLWTEENTVWIGKGSKLQRRCRECKNEKSRARKTEVRRREGAVERSKTECPAGHPKAEYMKRTQAGHAYCTLCHRTQTRQAYRRKVGLPVDD